MPVINVWCLPKTSELNARKVHLALVGSILSIKELEIEDERDITTNFFTADITYGFASEIGVSISGLFKGPKRTEKVRQRLAEEVGTCVKKMYPMSKVECIVDPFIKPEGFWSSEK